MILPVLLDAKMTKIYIYGQEQAHIKQMITEMLQISHCLELHLNLQTTYQSNLKQEQKMRMM